MSLYSLEIPREIAFEIYHKFLEAVSIGFDFYFLDHMGPFIV